MWGLQRIFARKGEQMSKKQTNEKRNTPGIIVERVYIDEGKMEDVFQPINEEVTRRKIEEKLKTKITA
jgi:hypothetical protein